MDLFSAPGQEEPAMPSDPLLPNPLLLPGRTLADAGASLKLGVEARAFGPHGVLVHGRSLNRAGHLASIRAAAPDGVTITPYEHAGSEPTLEDVEKLRAFLRTTACDWVAAVGGGSIIDLAKAAAGLLHAPEPVAVYQAGAPIPAATLPLIAVPTTAGTGAEATVVAVLTDPRRNLKQSIRHPTFMPRVVILDPHLLNSCPAATIAASGMDAFVQAFESFTSRYATPFTKALSELALTRITHALLPMYQGDHTKAADLLQGSYLAGLSLSHARLGVVHGLAHPLGSRWHVAHGLACAACLPAALRFNSPVIGADLAHLRLVLGRDVGELAAAWMAEMRLISPFRGQMLHDREAIIKETLASGSTAANPRPVTAADVDALLADIFTS
jgi:alcohol dehydrogenase class IV